MALSDALLPEFDHEMANTRKVLERVPEDKFGWKPHAKSGTMGWLASHIADMPGWAVMALERESLDLSPGGTRPSPPAPPASAQELLEKFDKNVAAGRAAIAASTDGQWSKMWSLLMNGAPIFTLPRSAVVRSMVMNHIIHHRAQLGVYLRLNEVPIPGLYGPSADEPM